MNLYLAIGGLGTVSSLAVYKYFYYNRQDKFDENTSFDCDFKKHDSSKWMAPSVTPEQNLFKNEDIRSQMELLCMELQAHLCHNMEAIDGKAKFFSDAWQRKNGGGGISCVLQDGKVFEKAGVNISVIDGTLSTSAVQQMKEKLTSLEGQDNLTFNVVGISSVIHPKNPHAPTMHFNFRYFEVSDPNGKTIWWFGGGCDLTPSYLYEEDAKHFHLKLKDACDLHDTNYYPQFKKWCDKYFYIQHRGEGRGVGGVFFDDLDTSANKILDFIRSCAAAIGPAYLPIIVKRRNTYYTKNEREWQLLRRGRYVEFNLIYDRGTKFGLFTPDARIESIFVSMPLYAKWVYCHDHTEDPRNVALIDVLRQPREWC